jgi:capsular exopolysaccharide synthesis family protein
MSRIFDALQRSTFEGASFDFPLISSLAAEVPQAAQIMQAMEGEADRCATKDIAGDQSLAISLSPTSRLVSLTEQMSLGAEKFRFLSVRLRQLRQTGLLQKVLVTSAVPEEGKSMVSANLAITLAQRRPQKILLLEGDLRRPSLSKRFGLPKLPGLSEYLQGDFGPTANIYHLEGAGFWFLPAGSPPENPLELIQSARLSELMDRLTGRFDWILIDSPPVLPMADTGVWTRSADGVLLVVREGTTEKRQLRRGLRALEQTKLLGVVLNNCANCDYNHYYQRYRPTAPAPQQETVEQS